MNDAPTLDPINHVTIDEDALEQLVVLTGITTGAGEQQPLRVFAASNNTVLIPTPAITYDGISTVADLRFTSNPDIYGRATITVTVEDGGIDGNLLTTADNGTTTRQFDIVVNPINDSPVAYDRSMSIVEAVERDGQTALLTFSASRLVEGIAGETASVPGDFPTTLGTPYNENEQLATLRVVAFKVPGQRDVDVRVPEAGLSVSTGTGTVKRTTVTGGVLTFNFVNGAFTTGSYAPLVDYNERTPFDATDLFTYIISDNGRTTDPQTNSVTFLREERSLEATVTLTVTQANDPPIFTAPSGFTFDENDGKRCFQREFRHLALSFRTDRIG